MHNYDWGHNQRDKRKHSRICEKLFDVISQKDYHHNHHKDCNCKDQCELSFIVLERNVLE